MLKTSSKKIIGLMITAVMLLSAFAVSAPAFADDYTAAKPSDAGIVLDTSYSYYSKVSNQIKILEDSILVMSHTSDKRYYIGSKPGTTWNSDGACITEALKSDSGYTLSYADENHAENADTASIKGGYIKAVKEAEILYIPIITTGKSVTFDGSQNVNNNLDGQAVEIGKQGGIGGKTADDMSYVLSVGETPVASGKYSRYEYSISSLGMKNANDQPFTFEANILMTGDAQMQFNIRQYTFVTIDKDGYFHYGYNSAMDTTSTQKIEKGKWHRIVIFYDVARNRLQLYSDGDQIAMSASVSNPTLDVTNSIRYGLAAGSVNGSLAIDDVKAYVGYYPNSEKVSAINSDENIIIDSKNIKYNKDAFADADEFNAAVKNVFAASYAALCKADLSAPATDLDDSSNIVTVTSAEGNMYDYYTVTPIAGETFASVAGPITFDEKVSSPFNTGNYDGTYTVDYAGGIGNKDSSDKALIITDGTNTTTAKGNNIPQLNYQTSAGVYSKYVTVEADLYSENRNVPLVLSAFYNGASNDKKYDVIFTDGMTVNVGGTRIDGLTYSEKQWYKVAVTFDTENNKVITYLNGEKIKEEILKDTLTDIVQRVRISAQYNLVQDGESFIVSDVQKNSLKAADNFKIYRSAYDPSGDYVAPAASDNEVVIKCTGDKLYTNGANLTLTAAQLKACLGLSASDCTVYADNNYAAVLADDAKVSLGSVIVIESSGGEAYRYYMLADDKIKVYISADNKVYASVPYAYDKTQSYMLIIACYDGDELTDYKYLPVTAASETTDTEALDYNSAKTYKAFFWNVEGIKPVRASVVK